MRNFQRVARGFDVQPALAELVANPDLWAIFTARQDTPGSAHHDTECIVLRGPKTISHESVFNDLDADWLAYAYALPALRAIIALAGAKLGDIEQLGRVMVVNLKPGGRIDPHVDEGAYAAHYDRFHLVLQSRPGNWFYCGDEAVAMQPGELWKFDHHTEHKVANLSEQGRIHIIIDARLSGKGA
jgi:hypothetical protein